MRTFSAKTADLEHHWFVVDADGLVLGRLASEVARVIRGKHKPTFTPHMDTGDNVIVINAAKIRLTGRKGSRSDTSGTPDTWDTSGSFPSRAVLAKHPERVIERAVYGMLPKTALGRQVLRRKLRVFAGPAHPHAAQRPTPLVVAGTAGTSRLAGAGTGESDAR